MGEYVVELHEIDPHQVARVGGKGAHLAELSRIEGIRVPPGFCVTTHAFRRIVSDAPWIADLLDQLSGLGPDDREAIAALGAEVRRGIEGTPVPWDVAGAVTDALGGLGEAACAVRSSATSEDSPAASFAGQHDTYLNVTGSEILSQIRRCWASLFSGRAIAYRLQNGIDHRSAQMAVVVQQMVFPQAAGILFTADPVTGNRKVASVEASFGLGEALVSGRVIPDVYKVRDRRVLTRMVGTKQLAIRAASGGGTEQQAIEPERQGTPALSDAEVVQLVELGRRIEAHSGSPQDIEWCLADDGFQFVQARPITTLYPVPTADDDANRVYVSVGHQQMMTDAMKPLGLSLFQLTAKPKMYEAGARLFVDVLPRLATPTGREGLMGLIGRSDPLIGDALQQIWERGDFVPSLPDDPAEGPSAINPPALIRADPAIVAELIEQNQASVAALRREIQGRSGASLVDFIRADLEELKRLLFDTGNLPVIMAAMQASWWLNERLEAWLGEKNAADVLTQSVPHNVTSEMGLALMDVADVIRPYPELVAFLERVEGPEFLNELGAVEGGRQAREAIEAYLEKYGMRCVGEIDITRPRWSERPDALVPTILSNVENFEPGAGKRRFEQGRQEALQKKEELLARLRDLPDGESKAEETEQMIDRVRTFSGYREYPKYGLVNRYFIYKQALLREAERLVKAGAVGEPEDVFYLTFEELRDALGTVRANQRLIHERKNAFRLYQSLTPPRVITSDGEVITGSYRRDDVPAGALVGLPVSAGTVEGRARVILDVAQADLRAGDILVTAYTDPSWTPQFVAIDGLVTEVGGLMTHGAVIAREYGLPAIVGVEGATELIRDGQRIRVHGTDGYVEILS